MSHKSGEGGSLSRVGRNGYAIAVAGSGTTVALRALLNLLLYERYPYMLFTLPVIFSAWHGGLGPGIAAAVLSTLAARYFFVAPYHSLLLWRPLDAAAGLIFLLIAWAISSLARRLRSTTQRAEEGERRIGEILESIADSFVAVDRDWRFAYINRAAEAMLGRDRRDLLGKNIWAEYPHWQGSKFGGICLQVFQNRTAANLEHYQERSKKWFEVSVYPAGEGGISLFFRDITARKLHAVEAARLAELVKSSGDAIISVSMDGVIQSWNDGAIELYGYTREEAIGRSIYMLLPPDRESEEVGLLESMRRGERVDHFETVRVRKDGKQIRISLSISPIRDAQGAILGITGIARDVTARMELEEQLRQAHKMESLGVLAGGVAHDFNNLLVAIMGNASLILDQMPAADTARPLLEEVIRASERAATLTRQLLAYSGRGRFLVERVDLSELVRGTAGLLRGLIPDQVELQMELAAGLPPVEVDTAQIEQLLTNLVLNGAESIGEGQGWVRVRTGVETIADSPPAAFIAPAGIRSGEYVWLEVQDSGPGMDEGTRSRIFDPFFTTKFLGRGLGLSAVSGIVRGHDGMLAVDSAPGRGTSIKVWLAALQDGSQQQRESLGDLMGQGHILLVDDEEIVRQTAKASLESYGYTAALADNGERAVELFGKSPRAFLLVILDLAMPGMGGPETFRRLKAIRPDIPILISSGFNELEASRRFPGKNVAGFLQKPYTALQLAEKIKSALVTP